MHEKKKTYYTRPEVQSSAVPIHIHALFHFTGVLMPAQGQMQLPLLLAGSGLAWNFFHFFHLELCQIPSVPPV